ncbi:MAG: glycine cleavage system protein GcvH [Deltaproteobacteria bacterium]|nr:glycine cleavage system protein GcvH [Deltaproteobacteria bacterium]
MTQTGLRFSKDHEWARQEGDLVTVGITDYAQHQLTDIVLVDLPPVGKKVAAGDPVVVVESTKRVADVYSPVAGEVAEVNTELEGAPELVNEEPYGKGWMVRIKAPGASLDSLMDEAAYQAYVEEQG